MRHSHPLGALLLTAMLFCTEAHAASSPPVRVSRLHLSYVVNADASYTEVSEIVQQLNSDAAVRSAGQMQIPYSSSLDEFRLLEAVTLKADGRRIPVAPGSIYTQDGLISAQGTTSFQDIKTTVIVYPLLAAGDSILLKTQVTRRKAVLPGTFTLARAFAGDIPYSDVVITVTAPKSLPLQVDNVDVPLVRTTDTGAGIQRTWSYQSAAIEDTEDGAVDPLMYRPRLLVSSLPSYRQLADAASQRFAGKAAVTPMVKQLADQITAGASTPKEQAQRIFDWVSKNVRYFAVVLDIGGYVPRSADEVLSSRFGDCKDHAVVMQALLSARNIRSFPALLNTSPLYELPKIPVLAAFDHVINYLPDLNVFLDSSAGSGSFGVLPYPDADKPVVLLGNAAVEGLRTPSLKPASNRTLLYTQINIRPDGRASGEDLIKATGPTGLAYSAWADSLGGQDPVRVAREFLLTAQLTGEGTVTLTPFDPVYGFSFTLLYELRNFADTRRPSGVRIVPPMDMLQGSARASVSETSPRRAPYQCGSRDEFSDITVTFPPGTQITLPTDISATAPYRQYHSHYQMKASNIVHIERQFISTMPRAYCPPSDFIAARTLQENILDDLRSEIRFALPGVR